MIAEVIKNSFQSKYNNRPLLIKSPGRINLIGEHTDYNLGFVMPAAIEKAIYFAIQENDSKHINIETFLTSPEQITFDLNGKTNEFSSFWGNYFKAILKILRDKKYNLKGFDCVFGGDIPIGSGLSSSAALCCGFIYAVSELLDLGINKAEIALIAQKAEHNIGLNCGLMDQYAVLYGKKSNALFLDCKTLDHKHIPINLHGYSWVLINSNIKHNLAVDSEYNKRRESCELVVNHLRQSNTEINSLRDVKLADLNSIKNEIPSTDFKRANYILEENSRVEKMKNALESGNANKVGALLLEGHNAMSKEYEITTKELDLLVSIGQKLKGVIGSRMMGGGFGGCTINLVKTNLVEDSITSLISTYKEETGIDAEVYELHIGDGVHIIS
ncbi:galactokinase [Maribacter sp. CXY002]|uniref:galactokinase n=1 Tax=Maribacter luteocoastalis TaxID=3407671 RepID=UPI003B67FA03